MNVYPRDTAIKLTATFTNGGAAFDPTTVTFYLRLLPSGTIQTLTGGVLSHDGTGIYSYTFTPANSGEWAWAAVGEEDGVAVAGSGDSIFAVTTSQLIEG